MLCKLAGGDVLGEEHAVVVGWHHLLRVAHRRYVRDLAHLVHDAAPQSSVTVVKAAAVVKAATVVAVVGGGGVGAQRRGGQEHMHT